MISDYSPVTIDIQVTRRASSHISWRFPSYLAAQTEFKQYLTREWENYATLNTEHRTNPILFWETGKAVICGRIISYVSAYKK